MWPPCSGLVGRGGPKVKPEPMHMEAVESDTEMLIRTV